MLTWVVYGAVLSAKPVAVSCTGMLTSFTSCATCADTIGSETHVSSALTFATAHDATSVPVIRIVSETV